MQAPHSTLLIPGPIELDDAVLQSMGHYALVALCHSCPVEVVPRLTFRVE